MFLKYEQKLEYQSIYIFFFRIYILFLLLYIFNCNFSSFSDEINKLSVITASMLHKYFLKPI